MVNAKDKYLALKRLVDYYPRIFAIIFCRTKVETQEVADKLIKDGYNAESLHGDLSQQQRDLTMQKFRQHTVQLLVATDVAARGLDVDDLTHVINYGLPDDIENYTHRSGRTGRAGKQGTSLSIVHSREKYKIRNIEREIGKQSRLRPSSRTSAATSSTSTRTTSSRKLCLWSSASSSTITRTPPRLSPSVRRKKQGRSKGEVREKQEARKLHLPQKFLRNFLLI